jgi:hypothetical protein
MTMREIKLSLPNNLAEEAEATGLLLSEVVERLLREEIRRRQVAGMFAAADRLPATAKPPLTPVEVAEEIRAARSERGERAASTADCR